MKKIWQWLTGSVIKEVGEVLDNLTTTKEEKLEAQRLITEILEKARTYTYTHPKTGKKIKMDKRSPEYKHLKLKDKTISKRNQLGK